MKKVLFLVMACAFSGFVFADMAAENMAAPTQNQNLNQAMPASDMNKTSPAVSSENIGSQSKNEQTTQQNNNNAQM
jgi:hypothetical protein